MQPWTMTIHITAADGGVNDALVYLNVPRDNCWSSYSPYIGLRNQGTWRYVYWDKPITPTFSYPTQFVVLSEDDDGTKNDLLSLYGFDPEAWASEGGTANLSGPGYLLFSPIPVADANVTWSAPMPTRPLPGQ
jgi:hypothetical protein